MSTHANIESLTRQLFDTHATQSIHQLATSRLIVSLIDISADCTDQITRQAITHAVAKYHDTLTRHGIPAAPHTNGGTHHE